MILWGSIGIALPIYGDKEHFRHPTILERIWAGRNCFSSFEVKFVPPCSCLPLFSWAYYTTQLRFLGTYVRLRLDDLGNIWVE